MKRVIIFAAILVVFFSNQNSFAQIVGFYPPVDTLIVGGGCTAPEIICQEFSSTEGLDSISIDPGFNTAMFVRDSVGNWDYFYNGYFLVNDSSDQFEYEIWYYPKFYHLEPPGIIPFDSSFLCSDFLFDLQLIVKEQNVAIDSLLQPFKAVSGLGVGDEETALLISQQIRLFQNYPNPFNPVTNIQFFLPKASDVRIEVFDVMGKKMATVINSKRPAGFHAIQFDGSNLSSGIYFYRLQAGKLVDVKKMVLMR